MSSFSLRLRTSFFLLLIVAATAASAQSASLPKTLLWRISGKGLARPSYLWGTVHIKDRRVFRFTDSLYRFLETSDGYAMELDPEEATATVVRFYAEKDTTPLLRDLLSPADFKRVGPKLEKELGIAAEAITQRRAWMYLQDHADLPVRKDDMPEAMDVYLYTIARSKQKVVTGIEDLKDQFDPAEEMKTALDVERLLKHNRHEIGYYEDLVRVYVAQDLNRVEKMTTSDTAGIEELVRRNRKMARRLDSLMALRPTFFTMGAAHLPGSDGVISLLRARGFTVEPVLGGRKVDPSDYHFERAQIGWVRSQNDSASFSVETPGAIAPVGTPPPGMSMSVHADVHTEMAYFLMDFLVGGDDLIDSVIVQRFALLRQGKKKAGPVRRLLVNGRSAYEMLMEDEEKTHYRVRGIGNGPEVILLMIGTQDERELKSADAERFFGSLKILRTRSLPLAASSNEPWQDCSDSTRGYSVQFPGAPEKDADMLQQLRAADAGSWRIETRSWFDATNSRFYVLAVRETLPGYIITDPNSIIEEAVTNLKARPGISITNIDTVRRDKYPQMRVNGFNRAGGLSVRYFQLVRGNRVYLLLTTTNTGGPDSLLADRFFRSFRLLPYPADRWATQSDSARSFSSTAPAPFERSTETQTAAGLSVQYVAHDSVRKTSFYVDVHPLSRYRWYTSDSAFFTHWRDTYYQYGDSVLSAIPITNGTVHGYEYRFRNELKTISTRRLRILPSGDSLYMLYSYLPETEVEGNGADACFRDFRIASPGPFVRDRGNVTQLLAALRSSDTTVRMPAVAFLEEAVFEKKDLPALHEALLEPYFDFDSTGTTIHDNLLKAVSGMEDPSTAAFLPQAYRRLAPNSPVKLSLLGLLAQQQTEAAYDSLKALLLLGPPPAGYSSVLSSALTDSLALTRRLFPEVAGLFSDSISTDWLLPATARLLDSGLLTKSDLAPYSAQLLLQAKNRVKAHIGGNDSWLLRINNVITFLQYWNEPAGNTLLRALLRGPVGYPQVNAVEALLRNKQPLSGADVLPLAANRGTRPALYTALQGLKRTDLFPVRYRNQSSFAESAVYSAANDEYELKRSVFVGTRDELVNGRKRRFYLYKVFFVGDDEKAGYPAVSGPFSTNPAEPTNDDVTAHVSYVAYSAKTMQDCIREFIDDELSGQ